MNVPRPIPKKMADQWAETLRRATMADCQREVANWDIPAYVYEMEDIAEEVER